MFSNLRMEATASTGTSANHHAGLNRSSTFMARSIRINRVTSQNSSKTSNYMAERVTLSKVDIAIIS